MGVKGRGGGERGEGGDVRIVVSDTSRARRVRILVEGKEMREGERERDGPAENVSVATTVECQP